MNRIGKRFRQDLLLVSPRPRFTVQCEVREVCSQNWRCRVQRLCKILQAMM